MRVGILENGLNEFREQRLAMPPAGLGNDHAFYVRHAFGRRPIANDGEANRLRSESGDEVGVPPVRKRVAMLGFAPAADKLLESRKPLGHHHESNILAATANELQRICCQFVPAVSFRVGWPHFATAYHVNRLSATFRTLAWPRALDFSMW